MKDAPAILVIVTTLCVLRLLLPIDLPQAYIIRSYSFVPRLEDGLKTPIFAGITLSHAILIIWAAGSLVAVIKSAVAHAKYIKRIRTYEYVTDDRILQLARQAGLRCDLRISQNVPTPYIAGVFRRTLYLPVLDLSDKQWEFVFFHELQHIRSKDVWIKALFFGIRVLFWWNPLAHISLNEIDLMLELRCDWNVTRKADKEQQIDYLTTIRDVLVQSKSNYMPVSASTFAQADKAIETRFDAILNRQTSSNPILHRFVPIAVAATVFVLSYFIVLQPAGFPSESEITILGDGHTAYDNTPDFDTSTSQYIIFDGVNYYFYADGEEVFILDEEALHNPPFDSLPIIGG